MYSLDTFAREYLSRPRVPRCVLCGTELLPGTDDGTGLAHAECGAAELDAIRFDVDSPFYVPAGMTADEIAEYEADHGGECEF